jgi:hypothetical protein
MRFLNIQEDDDSIIVDDSSDILQFYENIGIENKSYYSNSLLVDETS